jgi:hypothetical protein
MKPSVRAGTLVIALAASAFPLIGGDARAQTATPPEHRPAMRATPAGSAPYCSDLNRIMSLASARGRFAPIAGKPLPGNFLETTLPLTGWRSCALYGAATYTCDSHPLAQANEAAGRQADMVRDIIACLGEDWAEDQERSGAGYTVVHPVAGPASITLSIDQDDGDRYVVRLTLFVRASRMRG